MASTSPGSTPSLVKNAHYHAIKATETWAAFSEAMQALATESAAKRAGNDRREQRATTYARGTLGRS